MAKWHLKPYRHHKSPSTNKSSKTAGFRPICIIRRKSKSCSVTDNYVHDRRSHNRVAAPSQREARHEHTFRKSCNGYKLRAYRPSRQIFATTSSLGHEIGVFIDGFESTSPCTDTTNPGQSGEAAPAPTCHRSYQFITDRTSNTSHCFPP